MGVDDGRDRVGGVVETIHELETERDHERHGQQQVHANGMVGGSGRLDVAVNAVSREQETRRHDTEHPDDGAGTGRVVDLGPIDGWLRVRDGR